MTRHLILKYYAAAANSRVFFFPNLSTFSDPLDLTDHPLLLDMFSQGPPSSVLDWVYFFFSKLPLRNRQVREHKVLKPSFY